MADLVLCIRFFRTLFKKILKQMEIFFLNLDASQKTSNTEQANSIFSLKKTLLQKSCRPVNLIKMLVI